MQSLQSSHRMAGAGGVWGGGFVGGGMIRAKEEGGVGGPGGEAGGAVVLGMAQRRSEKGGVGGDPTHSYTPSCSK